MSGPVYPQCVLFVEDDVYSSVSFHCLVRSFTRRYSLSVVYIGRPNNPHVYYLVRLSSILVCAWVGRFRLGSTRSGQGRTKKSRVEEVKYRKVRKTVHLSFRTREKFKKERVDKKNYYRELKE